MLSGQLGIGRGRHVHNLNLEFEILLTFCGQKLKLPLYELYGSLEQVELSINQFNANQSRNELELGLRAIQL